PNGSETISVQPGDGWQGVYVFDSMSAGSGVRVTSIDPIRLGVNGNIFITGPASGTLDMQNPVSGTNITTSGNVTLGALTATNQITIGVGTTVTPSVTAATVTVQNGANLTGGSAGSGVTVN